ncbi:MAG: hypothetical protein FWG20_02035, partial [Candidatus Cloacimonetes bacterium]|nr:hypothetical protein [Candidatus Cloacimonadota bacterium]
LNYNPKYQGLRVSYFDRHKISGAIAVSEGQSAYVTFAGVEGKQGPYYLRPANVQQSVKIVSGTESIWLNGKLMSRGVDYRIDYNEGSIEFYVKHFISSNSRVQASFQYSDEHYRKDTTLAATELNITNRWKIKSALALQTDDKNNPLTESLTPADKELLKIAGKNNVYIAGESFIGNGYGLYRKSKIQLENGETKTIFIYAKGQPDSDYNVQFTWFGEGKGDYRQVTPSRFDYVGEGIGDFLPLREIVAPEHKANYDFSIGYTHDIWSLYAESLVSEYDQNTFSDLPKSDNISHIHHIQTTIAPEWDRFCPEANIWYRYKHKNLFTFADIRKPEEVYMFYSLPVIDSLSSSQAAANLKTLSFEILQQETEYKIIAYENIKQNQLSLYQKLIVGQKYPEFSYKYDFASSDNQINNELQNITIHEPEVRYTLKALSLRSNMRKYESKQKALWTVGERLDSYFGEIAVTEVLQSGVAVSNQFDRKSVYQNNIDEKQDWVKENDTNTWSLQSYTRFTNHYINALYSHREVKTYIFDMTTEKFDIAEIRTQNALFNKAIQLNNSYVLKTTEFYPKARELYYVGAGAGAYDSTGVATELGDYDYEYVIVGDPSKSIEVQANINAYTYPSYFVTKENELFDFLDKINLETNINISEQTENSERYKVYLLFPNALMTDLSIYSRQELRQTVWYNIQKNKWLGRYSYRYDRSQDRRYQGLDTRYLQENELSLRLLKVYNSDFEGIYKTSQEKDSRYDMDTTTQSHLLNIRTAPSRSLIFTTGIGYDTEKVTARGAQQHIDRYIASEDIVHFIGSQYRLNAYATIKYNDISDRINSYVPPDKQKGYNANWSANIDYRKNSIMTFAFDYSGSKNPQQDTLHQIKMEARAEF